MVRLKYDNVQNSSYLEVKGQAENITFIKKKYLIFKVKI